MSRVVVNTDLQSMLIDFGVYGMTTYPGTGLPIPLSAAFDKDYIRTFEKIVMPDGTQAIRVNTSDNQKYYVTHDVTNTTNGVLVVDSVEGVTPTSLDMLLNLLAQTKYITYLPYNISAAGTYTVKSGWGVLHAVNITSAVVSTSVKVYDGGVGGTLLAEIPFGITLLNSQVPFILDVRFTTSLVVVTTGLVKVQISYK